MNRVLLMLLEKYHGGKQSNVMGYLRESRRNRRQLCKDLEEDTSRLKKCKGTMVGQVPPALHSSPLFHSQPALLICIGDLAS